MSEEKLRYSLWECELCNDTFITDSKKRWSMVSCKCGKTSVDDEEFYIKCTGKPKLLQQSDNMKVLKQNKNKQV
jgi:hypothetical protein